MKIQIQRKKKDKKEFSKVLLNRTQAIFLLNLVAAGVFAWFGKDTSIFAFSIPTTGGVYGAAIIFYLNKAKIENIYKGLIAFLKQKPKILEAYPETHRPEAERQLGNLEDSMLAPVQQALDDALRQEISLQSFT